MGTTPAERARRREGADLPAGDAERFAGWGVMALPFRSGHVLALRRWPASSVGPAYTSVWHRDPSGTWQMWQTIEPELACPRYFSAAIAAAHHAPIEVAWPRPERLEVRIPGVLDWDLDARATVATRVMNAMMGLVPDAAWQSPTMLRAMGPMAGAMLGVGRVSLVGRTPNGHRFRTGPNRVWVVARSTAVLDGRDLGEIGPLDDQARLGDFWLPQRGIVAMGQAWFDLPAA